MTPIGHYRADIDGLRALAVLPVVAYHAFPGWVSGGFVGVDVFFVISGYLITRDILLRQAAGGFSIGGFYRRRMHRLFPALAVVLAACMLAGQLTLFDAERRVLLADLAASAGFVQNLWLHGNLGYFDTHAPLRPLLHLWSLAVEEQFYLLWPLLLVLVHRRSPWRPEVWAAALAVGSFATCLWLLPHDPAAAYYLLPARAWQLLAGATLALAAPVIAPGRDESIGAGLAAAAGALALLASLAWIETKRAYPGPLALLPTLGAVALLAGAPASRRGTTLLSHPILVAVGKFSYPLYLWHWPLLAFLRIYCGGSPSWGARLAAVALAFVLAAATQRWVERRLRPIGSRLRTGGLALVVAGLGVLALLGAQGNSGGDAASGKLDDVELYGRHGPGPSCDGTWLAVLPPDALCQQNGPLPSRMVIGDSHAHHLFAGLQQVDPHRRWRVASTSSCPPLVGVTVRKPGLDCGDRGAMLVRRAADDPTLDTVVLAFLGSYALDSNLAAEHVVTQAGPANTSLIDPKLPGAGKPAAFASGLERAVALLEAAGKHVYIVIDVPELPFEPRDCLDRPLIGRRIADCALPRSAVMARQAVLRQLLGQLVARHPAVRLFDPLATLCDADSCRIEREDVMIMRDSHHLSERGSAIVAAALLKSLDVP